MTSKLAPTLFAAALSLAAPACGDGITGSGEPTPATADASSTPGADARPDTPPTGPDATPGTADAGPTPDPAACAGLGAQPRDQLLTLTSGGTTRSYRLHVPASYDPRERTPVVLNFHGYTMDADLQESYTGMSSKADAEGFIAVHPEGLDSSWNAGSCCGTSSRNNVDDVGFVEDLLDELERIVCVDTRRVFSTGFSNGGFLSYRLACELGDRIAAIASVAGVNATSSCTPARPVPLLQLHGTVDSTVPYRGGASSASEWAARNGCAPATEVTLEDGPTTCESHPGCDGDADVTLCTIRGGEHRWPGALGAPGIPANDAIWSFFASHPLD